MGLKNVKTTTYSLEWEVVVNLEARLLKDFNSSKNEFIARKLLMISIGTRLGLRVIDNLYLKWGDLMDLEIGEKFVRLEKKTNKERILVMSSKLKEILRQVIIILNPDPNSFIFKSQKSKGTKPMTIQNFNIILKEIMKEYKIKCIGATSSHLLRKSFIVGSVRKGFESGDFLSLSKVSKLVGHSNISTTMRYTNFETSTMLSLYELN